MFPPEEKPPLPPLAPARVLADIGAVQLTNGFIGWVFSASAPVAIILAMGTQGGLDEPRLASWIFGVFFVNGLLTIALSWLYREPVAIAWTIPGTVLVGPALAHAGIAEVVGAYVVTGVILVGLGLSGWVRRAMKAVPMPIVMGMVAGVFLRFGLDLVRSLAGDPIVAAPMVVVWVVLTVAPDLGRRLPPIIGALLAGAVAAVALGRFDGALPASIEIVRPVLQTPAFSWTTLVELVVPLGITVLVVQNAQGFAVLRNAGHTPPIDVITVVSGLGSLAAAAVGAVSSCLAGPTNAILTSSGPRERHYAAAVAYGAIGVVFALVAPALTHVLLAAPKAFVATLAGLAMIRVLQTAFVASFKGAFSFGALVCFLVTVADIAVLGIGAPFWGMIAGLAASWLLERDDLRALAHSAAK